jgi:type II secretion system protein C
MINKIKDFIKNKNFSFRKRRIESDATPTGKPAQELDDENSSDQSDKASVFERLKNNISIIWAKYNGRRLKPFKVGTDNKDLSFNLTLLSPKVSLYVEKILGQSSRTNIHQVFLVIFIATITYSLGKMTALTLNGKPTLDSSKDYSVSIDMDKDFNPMTLAQVKSINIFRTNTGLGQKVKATDSKCETAQGKSNLPIKLVNTIVLQDTVKSLASVQVRGDRVLAEVREGELIGNMAKVFKIDRLELLVKNLENGACESIASGNFLPKGNDRISVMSPTESKNFLRNKKISGIENVGNKFKISKGLIDEKMKDIGSILSQARAIKVQNPDGTLAFKLTEMDPEGIFPYLGLQDQDIITSINGKPIYDMNEVMSLFAKIKNLENLSLGVRREGSDSVQEYSIKK